jgi:hypothetical protein
MLPDQLQYSLRIFEYFSIFHPDYSQACGIQESFANRVLFSRGAAVMRGAVQLEHKAFPWAIEIHDVRTDALLPPEFPAVQAAVL